MEVPRAKTGFLIILCLLGSLEGFGTVILRFAALTVTLEFVVVLDVGMRLEDLVVFKEDIEG